MTAMRSVFLKMAGNVVAGEALDTHELEDARRYGLLHTELLDCLHESPMQLRRPLDLQ